MSVAEMKVEAISKITDLNDAALLQEVLTLLKKASGNQVDNHGLSKHYDAIKEQYGDVLQKLAQ